LARNVPPVFKCEDCKKEAEYIDPFEHMFYCMECSDEYESDEMILLPVSNSPRMGVCGYDGELDDFEFDPAVLDV
jgi:hypothetical protein